MGQQTWIDLDNIDITTVGSKPETRKTAKILLTKFQNLNNSDNIDITFVGNKPETLQRKNIEKLGRSQCL